MTLVILIATIPTSVVAVEKSGLPESECEELIIEQKTLNLWKRTVAPYLMDDLWNAQNIYDAGHHLMVPLHASFYFEQKEWQNQFADHFKRFVDAYEKGAMGVLLPENWTRV